MERTLSPRAVGRPFSQADPAGGYPWHTLDVEQSAARLNSDAARGLSQVEAARRLVEVGPNELQTAGRMPAWALLLEQFKNVLILILLAAVGLSVVLGHGFEALAIALIVLFAVILGFVQEYRAERAIESLRRMAAPTASVIRASEEREIAARELVPGDVILVRAGDRIPADARLIEAVNLRVEEAALTGESVPVEKDVTPIADPEAAPGDRRNMAYAGTLAAHGRGRAIVVATGMQTEFGNIARLLNTVESSKTPLQINLDRVGSILARGAVMLVLAVVGLGLLRGQPFLDMLIFGIALAVAIVPEALPAVVTISLAIGVQRMVRRHALVRRLPAVETLGSVSVICSDKTGTLTKDEMTVRKLFVAGQLLTVSGAGYAPQGTFSKGELPLTPGGALTRLLRAAALASDAYLTRSGEIEGWQIKGDPTEGALVVAAAKAGLDKTGLEQKFPRMHEIPFTSESKRMTTLHTAPGGMLACSKGAPEIILDSCTHVLTDAGEVPLDPAARQAILVAARHMASEALRVLGIADKPNAALPGAERGMIWLGLVGMIDPPRPEASQAIQTCRQAGIKPVMITGDHPLTAQAVAREVGLLRAGRVVTGAELEAMADTELAREVEAIEVYARVSPAHKLRVVTALQQQGHCVAMTGDGVNDAPALKKADIGIAMGITGTDVSKEASAMTLTDDNFASIVAAVEEGRAVFGNIKKYLMYLFSSNIGEIGLIAGASLLGMPLPLSAVQILYINLATDGLPALALAVDPPEADLMRRPPRSPRTGIFTRPVVTLMGAGGLWSTLINLGLFSWALNAGRSLEQASTMVFVALILIELSKAYNFRSERRSALQQPFANRWLNRSILLELALLGLIMYVPFLAGLFNLGELAWADWLIVLGVVATVTPVLELVKWMQRRGGLGTLPA
jgi:Ca2+-transporting ATPase